MSLQEQQMKVVLLTEAAVDNSHGTGNLLLRLLKDAPFSVSCLHLGPVAERPEIPSHAIAPRKTLAGVRESLMRRLPFSKAGNGSSNPLVCRWTYRPGPAARRALMGADLVLAVVYSPAGLRLVNDCLSTLEEPPPSALWFMDFLATKDDIGDAELNLPMLSQCRLWAFNEGISKALKDLLPSRERDIEQHTYLGVPIPHRPKTVHREVSAHTRCVMIGNIWDATVLPVLDAVWTQACDRLGLSLSVHWHAPPEAHARAVQAGIKFDGTIRYEGYAPNLEAVLCDADAAIMPFSAGSSLFSRCSFPSRVADYAAHGLPVFAICGHDTPLAAYLRTAEAGSYSTGECVEEATSALVRFLSDRAAREIWSAKGRQYAESHFDLDRQRTLFISELESAMAAR